MANSIGSTSKVTFQRRGWVNVILMIVLVAVCIFVVCPEADAAPGGQFVKQALKSKYGRIGGIIVGGLMLIAFVLFLPLILYVQYKEWAGIRKTKSDLARLAMKYNRFEWTALRAQIKQTVTDVAKVWASGDLSSVCSSMTADYFNSQQELLQRWVDEGKQIVYRLEKIQRIEPLAVSVEDEETHSWIRVLVSVDCVDYMRDQHTREVIKGEIGTTSGFESVWVFVHQKKEWLLSGIEQGSTSLSWASEKNRIDTSYLDSIWSKRQKTSGTSKVPTRTGAKSQTASSDLETDQPTAKPKQRLVRKPSSDEDQ